VRSGVDGWHEISLRTDIRIMAGILYAAGSRRRRINL
jgi:hypothetical protein